MPDIENPKFFVLDSKMRDFWWDIKEVQAVFAPVGVYLFLYPCAKKYNHFAFSSPLFEQDRHQFLLTIWVGGSSIGQGGWLDLDK